MLNPEKILGGLLRGSSRSKGMLGRLGAGGAGLALLGVAMEAAEHFMNKAGTAQSAPPPIPHPGASTPAPPPQPTGAGPAPPPAPGTSVPAAPPPPPPPGTAQAEGVSDAVLLIRSMIAAANADGMIDQEERGRIMQKLENMDLNPEEQAFLNRELQAPCEMETITDAVKTPETARQVYAVSLMAIEVDTAAEREYLRALAARIGLDDAALDEIHRDLGIARP